MVNTCDLANKSFSFAGMDVGQTRSSSVSYNSMLKFGSGLSVVQEISSLNVPMDEEVLDCEKYFLENGLVCRFNGFWLRLADLHKWIFETWKPLLMDNLNIYPMAQGFSLWFLKRLKTRRQFVKLGHGFGGVLPSTCSLGPPLWIQYRHRFLQPQFG